MISDISAKEYEIIRSYAHTHLAAGHSADDIRNQLVNAGYALEYVNKAINSYIHVPRTAANRSIPHKTIFFSVIIVLFFVAYLVVSSSGYGSFVEAQYAFEQAVGDEVALAAVLDPGADEAAKEAFIMFFSAFENASFEPYSVDEMLEQANSVSSYDVDYSTGLTDDGLVYVEAKEGLFGAHVAMYYLQTLHLDNFSGEALFSFVNRLGRWYVASEQQPRVGDESFVQTDGELVVVMFNELNVPVLTEDPIITVRDIHTQEVLCQGSTSFRESDGYMDGLVRYSYVANCSFNPVSTDSLGQSYYVFDITLSTSQQSFRKLGIDYR